MVESGIIYGACVAGAIGVLLLLPRRGNKIALLGGVLAAGALGAAFLALTRAVPQSTNGPGIFFYVFSFIAAAGAIRMITHPRPVYAALYFILVVLASGGLLVLLSAEFMAFALIIVYAGAILITYMFVIMLAQEAPESSEVQALTTYDAVAREPFAATAVCFVLLAAVLGVSFRGTGTDAFAAMAGKQSDLMVATQALITRDTPSAVENVERVGVSLLGEFPVSLEVAGIILMMAMLGAVVLSRKSHENEPHGMLVQSESDVTASKEIHT